MGYNRALVTVSPFHHPTGQLQPLPYYFSPYFFSLAARGQVSKYGLYIKIISTDTVIKEVLRRTNGLLTQTA
jgi:hypothetical protein